MGERFQLEQVKSNGIGIVKFSRKIQNLIS